MSARGSNAIFWVIGGIVALMLAAAGTMLWVSLSRDAARGYIPPEQREEPPTAVSPRAKRIVAVVAALAALAIVLPFAIRWSRPCEEERERARATWTSYADHVAGTRAEAEARAVLEALDGDLGEAVEHGDSVLAAPAPDDERGATLYREALERLSLAEGPVAQIGEEDRTGW